jgi:hypothetical protein
MMRRKGLSRSPGPPPAFWREFVGVGWMQYESSELEMRRYRDRLYKAVKRSGEELLLITEMSDGVLYFMIDP